MVFAIYFRKSFTKQFFIFVRDFKLVTAIEQGKSVSVCLLSHNYYYRNLSTLPMCVILRMYLLFQGLLDDLDVTLIFRGVHK